MMPVTNGHVYYQQMPDDRSPTADVAELAWTGSAWVASDTSRTDEPYPMLQFGQLIGFAVDSAPRLYYEGMTRESSLALVEAAWTESGWVHTSLPGVGSLAAGFALRGTHPRIYYLSGSIREMAWDGSTWLDSPITDGLDAPEIGPYHGMTSFAVSVAGQPRSRVYYIDASQQVCELAWTGDKWAVSTIGEEAGAPLARGGLTGFALGGTASRVYYLDTDGYVNELAWTGSKWASSPIAKNAGALRATSAALTSFEVQGNASRIYYIDQESYVSELALTGGRWVVHHIGRDVQSPRDVKAPEAATQYGVTGFAANGADSRVYYIDEESNVNELAWTGQSWAWHPIGADHQAPRAATDARALTCIGL